MYVDNKNFVTMVIQAVLLPRGGGGGGVEVLSSKRLLGMLLEWSRTISGFLG